MQVNNIHLYDNNRQNKVQFSGKNRVLKAIINPKTYYPRTISQMDSIYTITSRFGVSPATARNQASMKKSVNIFRKYLAEKVARQYTMDTSYTLPDNGYRYFSRLTKEIKKPTKFHIELTTRQDLDIYDLRDIFAELSHANKKQIKLLNNLSSLNDTEDKAIKLSKEQILEVLSKTASMPAENLNHFVKNFSDYKSFIILNHKKQDFIPNLFEIVNKEISKSEVKKFDEELTILNYRNKSQILKSLPLEALKNNYNSKTLDFLSGEYCNIRHISIPDNIPQEKITNFYLLLLNKINDKNVDLYASFFEKFKCFSLNKNSIESVNEMVNRINSDKDTQKIIQSIISSEHKIKDRPLSELLFYIDKLGSDKISANIDNFLSIVPSGSSLKVSLDEIAEKLSKNLKSKNYVSETTIDKLVYDTKYIIRNPIKRFFTERKIKHLQQLKNQEGDCDLTQLKIKDNYAQYTEKLNSEELASITIIEVPQKVLKSGKTIRKTVENSGELTPYQIKKLVVKQESQEIINKWMKSKKQINEQAREYELSATKMRNQMLPKLFEFVAKSRAQQRALGIKNPKISNADVIDVYQKINGKNKKELNTMLSAKDGNGNLKYTLKEIEQRLEEINMEQYHIRQQKLAKKRQL